MPPGSDDNSSAWFCQYLLPLVLMIILLPVFVSNCSFMVMIIVSPFLSAFAPPGSAIFAPPGSVNSCSTWLCHWLLRLVLFCRQPEGGAELQSRLSVQHRGADLHRDQQWAATRRWPRISWAPTGLLSKKQSGPKPDLSGPVRRRSEPHSSWLTPPNKSSPFYG